MICIVKCHFFIQIASDVHSKTAFAIHISTVVYSETPFFRIAFLKNIIKQDCYSVLLCEVLRRVLCWLSITIMFLENIVSYLVSSEK